MIYNLEAHEYIPFVVQTAELPHCGPAEQNETRNRDVENKKVSENRQRNPLRRKRIFFFLLPPRILYNPS